jgi:type I restriction enzyme S subunit
MNWSPYPAYRDSDSSWIGSIPSNWRVAQLKRVASRITDGAHVSPETDGGVYDFVSTRDVTENGIDFGGSLKTTPESYEYLVRNGCRPVQGDVLFSKDGTIGRTVVVASNHPFVVASSLIIIRPNRRKATPDFLHFLCQAKSVVCQVDSFVRGAGLPRLSVANLTKIFGAFPPIEEQRQIARFLSRETAKIDALIAKQEQLIATLREDRTATITHAVTEGLDPKIQLVDSGVRWLGDMPDHWVRARLRDVVVSIDSGASVNGTDVPAEQGEVGVLKTSCVSAGWFNPQANKTVLPEEALRVSCQVRAGQVIVNRANTPDLVGSAGYVAESADDLYLSDLLWALSTTGVEPQFLHLWMQTPVYRTQVAAWRVGTSASMQKVSKASLRAFSIALPPESEQRQVVDFLTVRTATIDALIAKAHAVIETLREYRSALITDAVTGKIDVRGAA